MPWAEFLAKQTKRWTLEEIGCPEFYVDIRDINSLPYGEAQAIAAIPSDATDEDRTRIGVEILSKLIVSWNITDPETNEPLPIPSKDPKSLDRLPGALLVLFGQLIAEQAERKNVVPFPNEINSTQP